MMRPLRLLSAIAFLIAGIAIGSLNAQPVRLDLGVISATLPLGVALLAALLLGVIVGGLTLTVSVVLPLQRRMRQERIRATLAAAATPER